MTETNGMPRRPDFFIVGAPKCATTAMHRFLRSHPEIFMPEAQEILYFGSDLKSPGTQQDEAWYLRFFADAGDAKRVGEKSVWYLYSRRAAEEIHAFAPDGRIIIMLRDPVDMLYSQHSQFLANGFDLPDFEQAVRTQDERRTLAAVDPLAAKGLRAMKHFHTDNARFTEQVKRYFDIFGRDRVHVIIHDDLKADAPGVYRKTLRFLEVSEEFAPTFAAVNTNKTLRSRWMNDLLRNPPGWLRAMGRLVGPEARQRVRRRLMHANARQEPREPMTPAFRCELQDRFAEEVRQLSDLLGRDLTHWSRHQASGTQRRRADHA